FLLLLTLPTSTLFPYTTLFRSNIKLARNADYWKPGRPYLDGVEYTIIPNRSTAILGFIAGKFDMTFPYEVTIPLLKDIQTQLPKDRKSTRLNSSHVKISYAVFC